MVPFVVPAIVINQGMSLHPFHSPVLLPRESTWPERWGRNRSTPCWGEGRATACFKIRELSYKWLVTIISFVFSILGRPRRGIPYWSINPHWSQGKCLCTFSWIPPYWHIIHQESVQQISLINSCIESDGKEKEKDWGLWCFSLIITWFL